MQKVRIENIDPMPDNQSIYFSTDKMYNYAGVENLADICLEIDDSERGEIDGALFFRASIAVPTEEFEVENEDAAWVAFANLIANDNRLLINDNAKNGLFIRFNILSGDKRVNTGLIHKSSSLGETRGVTLSEGNSYELVFYHRIPCLIDQNRSIKQPKIEYKIPSGNLELNHWEEELTSNYQKHVLNVSAIKPSGTYEEMTIDIPEEVTSEDGATIIKAVKYTIPLKVRLSHLYRFKKTYSWLLLIWGSLFGNVYIGQELSKNADSRLWIISGALAVFSAIGVYSLQRRK